MSGIRNPSYCRLILCFLTEVSWRMPCACFTAPVDMTFFVSRSRSCMRPVGLCFWESCMRGLWRAGMPAAERIMPFLWMKCRKQNWQSVAFQRFFSETVRFHDHVRYTIKVSTFTQDCELAALSVHAPCSLLHVCVRFLNARLYLWWCKSDCMDV